MPKSDLAAANQLQISLQTITPAQAWMKQVRGTYNFIYTYAMKDFLHIDDFSDWVQNYYQLHTHAGVQNGGGKTLIPDGSKLSNTRARSLLEANAVLGQIRTGISEASILTTEVNLVNKRQVT